jgi:hypothetical protein
MALEDAWGISNHVLAGPAEGARQEGATGWSRKGGVKSRSWGYPKAGPSTTNYPWGGGWSLNQGPWLGAPTSNFFPCGLRRCQERVDVGSGLCDRP